VWGVAALALALPLTVASAVPTAAQAADDGVLVEVEGNLADGTEYFVRKPADWNGSVIIDLDGSSGRNRSIFAGLLDDGYGTAGTTRQGDRAWVSQETDLERTMASLDMFEAEFGPVDRAIVYGRSAGGAVAITAAELYPDRIDGAVALCAVNAFLVRNQIFDFFYTLKMLLGPDDDNLRIDEMYPGTTGAASRNWENAIAAAGETPEGRARIALAFAMSEYPIYGSPQGEAGVPKPDFGDPASIADAMVASALKIADRRIGNMLIFDESTAPTAAPPGTTRPQIYGNVGANYAEYWALTDPIYQQATQDLYTAAGLDLTAEIALVDGGERVPFDGPGTLATLESQAEVPRGDIGVPLFRMDNIGDMTFGPQGHQTYNDMVADLGHDDLYRTSLVDNSGHCNFPTAQQRLAIDIVIDRLDDGVWPATDAASLNARLGDPGTREFIDYDFTTFNGDWRLHELADNLPGDDGGGEVDDGVDRVEGEMADGTLYLLQRPENWNGVVIADLDGRLRRDHEVYQLLIEAGYGTAGTRRQGDRAWVSQETDMERTLAAMDLFEDEFGPADRHLIFGRSAGGGAAISASELAADRIDGAIALCGVNAFLVRNQIFDFFYTLKMLIDPDDDSLVVDDIRDNEADAISARWREVIEQQGQTAEGRARIALAFAMSEYPIYGHTKGDFGVPQPDFADPESVADAMVASALQIADRRIGNLLVFDETDGPAYGAPEGVTRPQLYGNVGADYLEYWDLTDPIYRGVAEDLYDTAGLDLRTELTVLDASPRVSPDAAAVTETLTSQVEAPRGLPEVPLFRMDNIGDQTFGPQGHQTHNDLVANNGRGDLYRSAIVDNSGHCFFHAEQELAAIEVMMERLDTGVWPATDAAALNARAGVTDDDGRVFIDYPFTAFNGQWRLQQYPDVFNLPRDWVDTTVYTQGDTVRHDGAVYEAMWWTQGQEPGTNPNGAWQEIRLNADGDIVWTASRVFDTGDVVVYDDATFEAFWWNRNETPGANPNGAWQEIRVNEDGGTVWTPSRVFEHGDVAVHDGVEYVAQWWNRNSEPGNGGPWQPVI